MEAVVVPVRVLLVDDDQRFADLVHRVLVDDGYDVVGVVAEADEVSEAVSRLAPDVIVLDVVLHGGDGLEVADELRAAGSAVPVVLFSSLLDRRIGASILERGYGYVEKAAGVDALEAAIDGVIDLRDPPNRGR